MTLLFCDLETYSDTPITHGVHRYAERAEVLIWAYAIDDGPVTCWDVTAQPETPTDLLAALHQPDATTVWHNGAMFDSVVLGHAMPALQPRLDRMHDTMVMALAHSLPGSLGLLGEILGIPEDQQKHKRGRELINLFCKPRPKTSKIRRATRETHPAEWAEFLSYAGNDVAAMRAIYKKLPRWNYKADELVLWHLDQRINRRGVAVDLDLAHAAIRAAERAQAHLAERTQALTDGDVMAATQRDKMLAHILAAYGVTLPDLQISTLERRIDDPDIPPELRELLAIRLQAGKTSAAKYRRVVEATSQDGRLRGLLQFDGASRTGRWSGRLFQPQNLPRPTHKQAEIEFGINAMKADAEDLLFDDVMALTSSAIRGVIVSSHGKKLVVADLSNIEGRVLAWLAGEEWKLQAFRDYDAGAGPDLYKMAYARSFGLSPAEVDKDQRQVGKVLELACLGPYTRVLTHSGIKGITEVSNDDLLWDGQEWVKHKGLVARGVRQVVNVAGIAVTPDHLVKVKQTWMPAGALAISESILSRALATGSESLPYLVQSAAAGTNPATYDSSQGKRIKTTGAKPEQCKTELQNLSRKIQTYDIAYSGPRNCFTVISDRGPLLVHNCGYEGGVGAFLTFSLAYGIDLEALASATIGNIPQETLREAGEFHDWAEKQKRSTFGLSREAFVVCDSNKRLWREAHPNIASWWKDLGNAARIAINRPGESVPCRSVKFRRDGNWLRIALPSGRALCYPSPLVDEDGQISYMGINQYSRKWSRLLTYGGKLAENITQGVARDVLASSMAPIEAAGYEIVLTIHDEIIAEAPDSPEFNPDHLAGLMSTSPHWAGGLPLAAEGFEAMRYRK